jgi:dolichol kinase
VKSAIRNWQSEILRKGLHALGCVWAVWGYFWPRLVVSGLSFFCVLYILHEIFRLRGRGLGVIERLGNLTRRQRERKTPALGPVALAAGIIICFLVFDARLASAAVLAACGCDCAAGVVGTLWGRHALPFIPRKTVEGTLAGFGVAFVACVPVVGLLRGFVAAAVAAIAEAMPLEDLDNIAVPVAAACVLALL